LENKDIKSAEYVLSDEDIEDRLDTIYNDFLKKCSDMSPRELNRWVTIEDRELIYYHQLSGREKRLMNYFLRISAASKVSDDLNSR